METSYKKYVIHNGGGKYLWGFQLSKVKFKPDFGWVDKPKFALFLSFGSAFALLTFLSFFCDVSAFGILEVSGDE